MLPYSETITLHDSPRKKATTRPSDDVRDAAEKLQKVLAYLDQTENAGKVLAELSDVKAQLKQAIQEKNYWMKKCAEKKEFDEEINSPSFLHANRRRTNSELQVIADTIAIPGRGIDTEHSSPVRASPRGFSHGKRSSFRLLQCSDEQCEVFQPRNGSIRTHHHARSNVQLMWDEAPSKVLMIKKPNDPDIHREFEFMAHWLASEKGLKVFVEPNVYDSINVNGLVTWDASEWDSLQKQIDFIVCLGGDGTILWVSSLFNGSVPPVVSFAMGSLGFLTPFEIGESIENLTDVIKGGFYLSLRSRLSCSLVKSDQLCEDMGALDVFTNDNFPRFQVLNEVVIDRGPSAALVELDCYCDGLFLTRVTADGIIIGTPTGSTAYSLSAGGSMVHPSVPSMLFTPICPHTLSFRPLLFHDNATLKITVPYTSRSSAFISFDGKSRLELDRGDALFIKVSPYPVPSVCKRSENEDWFQSVKDNLNWNQRQPQKPIGSVSVIET